VALDTDSVEVTQRLLLDMDIGFKRFRILQGVDWIHIHLIAAEGIDDLPM
jgi:hypothetical protein